MSDACGRVLYCHCANAKVIPAATKTAVLDGLYVAHVEHECEPDLCQMAAHRDTRRRWRAKVKEAIPPMLRVPAQTKRKQLEKAEPGQDPSYFTLTTALPFERPVSMYGRAS